MKNHQKNNIDHKKLEINYWIISIDDEKLLKKIFSPKEKSNEPKS